MSSLIKVTPLCGARNEHPLCYLLEIDEACILLDCGWDETFDMRRLVQLLRKYAPRIDAVLLSHCDIAHLGALPFLLSQTGVRAKVYATLPVVKMGQLTVYDAVLARSTREDFDLFNLDDIDSAWAFDEKKQGFKHFVPLRYIIFGLPRLKRRPNKQRRPDLLSPALLSPALAGTSNQRSWRAAARASPSSRSTLDTLSVRIQRSCCGACVCGPGSKRLARDGFCRRRTGLQSLVLRFTHRLLASHPRLSPPPLFARRCLSHPRAALRQGAVWSVALRNLPRCGTWPLPSPQG